MYGKIQRNKYGHTRNFLIKTDLCPKKKYTKREGHNQKSGKPSNYIVKKE